MMQGEGFHLLSVRQLRVQFATPGGPLTAVEDVSFDLEKGETLVIIGETGCGKSVTARAILGLHGENAVTTGEIYFKDKNLLALSEKEFSTLRGREISIILQNPDLALNPVIPVGRQLIEPLKHHLHLKTAKALDLAKKTLEQMGFRDIEGVIKKYPFQLSGGMNQRILIAASILTGPDIIIADEPTRALDREIAEGVKQELKKAQQKNGSALLLITHDLDLARELSDRVVVMYAGEVVEMNRAPLFFEQPRHPYSKALLNSLPGKGFNAIPGMPPPLNALPGGCRFHPRCQLEKPRCQTTKPAMVQREEGQVRCLMYV